MMRTFLRGAVAAFLFAGTLGAAQAAPITFQFTFDDPASTALAVGSITFESTLLPNPGNAFFILPDPAVLALNVTVTGSANGNGNFTLSDFTAVVFDTNDGTLNFGSQLVGQSTAGSPWGTTDGNGGDFNLFSNTPKGGPAIYGQPIAAPHGINPAPNGVNYFTLGANGGFDEPMELVGMSALGGLTPAAALPIGRGAWLALAVLLAMVALVAFRRRSQRN